MAYNGNYLHDLLKSIRFTTCYSTFFANKLKITTLYKLSEPVCLTTRANRSKRNNLSICMTKDLMTPIIKKSQLSLST